MSVRLIVGDANRSIRLGFSLLAKSISGVQCVGETTDHQELLELDSQNQAHIILLDKNLLEQTARPLRLAHPMVKLILLNKFYQAPDIEELHMAGAIGHICPDASNDHIQQAIEAAYLGQPYQTADQCITILPPHPATYFSLNETELALLCALPIEDQHLTLQQLGLSPLTFGLYSSSLMAKLGVQTLQEAREVAIKHGICKR